MFVFVGMTMSMDTASVLLILLPIWLLSKKCQGYQIYIHVRMYMYFAVDLNTAQPIIFMSAPAICDNLSLVPHVGYGQNDNRLVIEFVVLRLKISTAVENLLSV